MEDNELGGGGGIVEIMATKINAYRVLEEKLRKKGLLAKHRRILQNNIKVGLKD